MGSFPRHSVPVWSSSKGHTTLFPGPASLPEVEVGEGCEIPQSWVQASQAIVVETQALQGHQLACCLWHFGEPVPRQV